MTLNQVAKEQFKGLKKETRMIGIYKEGEKIYPDFADEILETHGELEVKDFQLVKKDGWDILVVEF